MTKPTQAKVVPSSRPRTPWAVQYRATFWYFKTKDAADTFCRNCNQPA